MVRQFLYSAFADLFWRAMTRSRDATLAAIAAKAEKEAPITCATPRNGSSASATAPTESHPRARKSRSTSSGLHRRDVRSTTASAGLIEAGIAIDPAPLRAHGETLTASLAEATLDSPAERLDAAAAAAAAGTASISAISSAELQIDARDTFPGATW